MTSGSAKDGGRSDPASLGVQWHQIASFLCLVVAVIAIHRFLILRQAGFLEFTIHWDLTQFMWPKLLFLSDALRQGVWPLWNPYDFGGAPVFSNLQTLYHHPLILLYAATVGFSLESLQAYLLLLYLWGAVNVFLLARFFAVPPPIAASFGILYSVSGFALGNASHFPQLHLFLSEPLTLYLLLRFARRQSPANFSLATLGLCILISAGYPSILGHLLIFNLLFSAVVLHGQSKNFIGGGLALVAVFSASLLVMAPLLVPGVLSLPLITRGQGVSYEIFTGRSLPFAHLASVANPFLGLMSLSGTDFAATLKNCGVGIWVFLLVCYSALRSSGKKFLLAYFAISVVGCLGDNVFTGRLFYALPFVNNSRHVTFEFRALLILIAFLLAMVSTREYLVERSRNVRAVSFLLPLVVYAGLFLFIRGELSLDASLESLEWFGTGTGGAAIDRLLLMIAPIVFLVAYRAVSLSPRFAASGILLVAFLEALLVAPSNYATVLEPAGASVWHEKVEYERQRARGFPISEPFERVHVHPALSNYGSIRKIHTDWGMDGTILKSIDGLVKSRDPRLYGPFAWTPTGTRGQAPLHDFDVVAFSPNWLEATFRALERDETVLFNFMHYPGWRAISGGSERRTFPVHGGFLGVKLQAGDERVELRFVPTYYLYLLGVSGLAIFLLLAVPTLASRGPAPGREAGVTQALGPGVGAHGS